LEVLYATVMEPDMLEGLVDVPAERVHVIEKKPAPAAPQPVAPPPVAVPSEAALKAAVAAPAVQAESTIRLNVTLLDSLMTLAGELVLSRNQLIESLSRQDDRGIHSGAQRVSLVTSELQEVVTPDPDAAGGRIVRKVSAAGSRPVAGSGKRSSA